PRPGTRRRGPSLPAARPRRCGGRVPGPLAVAGQGTEARGPRGRGTPHPLPPRSGMERGRPSGPSVARGRGRAGIGLPCLGDRRPAGSESRTQGQPGDTRSHFLGPAGSSLLPATSPQERAALGLERENPLQCARQVESEIQERRGGQTGSRAREVLARGGRPAGFNPPKLRPCAPSGVVSPTLQSPEFPFQPADRRDRNPAPEPTWRQQAVIADEGPCLNRGVLAPGVQDEQRGTVFLKTLQTLAFLPPPPPYPHSEPLTKHPDGWSSTRLSAAPPAHSGRPAPNSSHTRPWPPGVELCCAATRGHVSTLMPAQPQTTYDVSLPGSHRCSLANSKHDNRAPSTPPSEAHGCQQATWPLAGEPPLAAALSPRPAPLSQGQELRSRKSRAAPAQSIGAKMAMEMRLPVARKPLSESLGGDTKKHLVVPGDTITTDTGFMRGHGTYMGEEKLIASVAGSVERVNKLICVKALKTRYNGEVGDIVVGRITEVQQKRWKVETNSRLDSVLLLSSMNLPGGELRRRSAEDELAMRGFLQEGDLISAEVQAVFSDGAVSLHTRSLKYGKVSWALTPELLGQGVLVQVSPSLVKRQKTHFHDLPCGASVILGNNGFIWIYPTPEHKEEDAGGFVANLEPVSLADREVISRLRNCIVSLVAQRMMLYDTSILYCYEASLPHQLVLADRVLLRLALRVCLWCCFFRTSSFFLFQIKDITKPEIMEEIVIETRQRLLEQEG
ncbi:Exosome complex component RRP4, partial [Galemys pyrenaicus]